MKKSKKRTINSTNFKNKQDAIKIKFPISKTKFTNLNKKCPIQKKELKK